MKNQTDNAVLISSVVFLTFCVSAEIPGFLSEDECRVVMQLAQLKGLMESQLMVQDGQEELARELNLSPEEIFNLLDINQDGQLQLHEVYVSLWTERNSAQPEVFFCYFLLQRSLTHSILYTMTPPDTDSFSSERWHLAHTRESARNLCWAQS